MIRHSGRASVALAAVALLLLVIGANPVDASPPGGLSTLRWGQSQRKGFDTCAAPTQAAMNTWWNNSPYWDVGIYVGGTNRSCRQDQLTPSWVTNVHNQLLWSFYLYWVGLQAPCNTRGLDPFSSNPTTAATQGRQTADNFVLAAANLGFDGMNVYYLDIEAYPTTNSGCRAAVNSFVSAYAGRIEQYWGERSGVYGSSCGSAVDDWWNGFQPDDVFLAAYNSDPDVWGISCVPNSHWVGGHRLHQWSGTHNETYGGVTIGIDQDCAYGDVTPHGHNTQGDTACTNE